MHRLMGLWFEKNKFLFIKKKKRLCEIFLQTWGEEEGYDRMDWRIRTEWGEGEEEEETALNKQQQKARGTRETADSPPLPLRWQLSVSLSLSQRLK